MIFSADHIRNFKALSWDRNDLHWNAAYSRRTPFGEPVVYGVAALLAVLGHWAKGRNFQLRSLQVEFKRPVLCGRDVQFDVEAEGQRTSLAVKEGQRLLARLKWEAKIQDEPYFWPRDPSFDFSKSGFFVSEPNSGVADSCFLEDCHYSGRWEDFGGLSLYGLKPRQLPLNQIQFFLFTSYLVGMQYPGRQALYTSLSVEFDEAGALERPGDSIVLSDIEAKSDPRFGWIQIAVRAPFLKSARVTCFRRPPAVDYSIESIRPLIRNSSALSGRHIFISGSSRGFGGVMAKAASLMGGRLELHGRQESEESRATLKEIQAIAPDSRIHYADLSEPETVAKILETLNDGALLDLVVLNASAPIPARGFLEQSSDDFMRFLDTSVKMNVGILHALLPHLKAGAGVLLVSSSYAEEAPGGFSHYVAAKRALEGLIATLAKEFGHLRFYILRPPRMLTDQTVSQFSETPCLSPIPVAIQAFERVVAGDSNVNFQVIDLDPGSRPEL